ncbi:peroxin Pex14/17-Penicillium chrysogenum [Penicillium sp. IBT 18751x]|nr:peroxin Pex14/17-Penicillium chrysogenum [Penicillium sp. IBT 18751x]
MSDPSSKPPSIPSWQRSGSAPDQAPLSSSPSSDAPASTSRQDLVDSASRFLDDESIRDAPTDRKVSFLESKGLNSGEIQQLLGVSRNPEATSCTVTAAEGQDSEAPPDSSSSSKPSEVMPSTLPSPATSSSSNTMSQPRSTATATVPSSAPRDQPPIITYPEFLFEPAKQPPLVTMSNILYTIYGAAGLGASIYGASEYLVKPMIATLTSARHDLAVTAQENLTKLNEKLEASVSVIPAQLSARKSASNEEDESTEDGDSVTSDPTELFHRDMGTQTTPDITPSPVLGAKDEKGSLDAPVEAVNNHISRLASIQSQLNEITEFEKDASNIDDMARSSLSDLHHYLDGLIYAAPTYTSSTPNYGLYTGNVGSDSSSTGVRKAEDDAIASFKADIRGVKGALLSARNFPASRGGRLGGVR